jgi:CMP/dCMP kinase
MPIFAHQTKPVTDLLMNKIVVAIDGYSGCGKSTTAKIVAEALGYIYIDSGAMYRAVTLYFLQNTINLNDAAEVAQALANIHLKFVYNPHSQRNDMYLNHINVEAEIRSMSVSAKVSEVSRLAVVRQAMVAQQQAMGEAKGVVMDGRDIGTRVFPHAELKIFMTADITVRAKRRQAELANKGEVLDLADIIENLKHRDWIDTTRQESPLKQAEDAYLLDSTDISIAKQTEYVIDLASNLLQKELST